MNTDTYCHNCCMEMVSGPMKQTWECPLCDHKCSMVTENQSYARMISKLDQQIANADSQQKIALEDFMRRFIKYSKRIGIQVSPTWTHWHGDWSDMI